MKVFAVLNIHSRIPNPSVHDALSPPPAFPAVKLPHVELPHLMQWSPMGASFSTTVLVDGFPCAQQGNDAGIGIFHVSIPPTNPLLPLTIATSMCKNLFGSGATMVNGKPAAGFLPLLAPILTCCFPIPLPGTMVPAPVTVMIDMNLADFLAGWARCLVAMAVSAVFAKFGGRIPGFNRIGRWASNLGRNIGISIASRLSSAVGMSLSIRLSRAVVEGVVTDAVKGATVSLITNGKVELPFQIGEYNPWTGDGKVFTSEFDTGQDLPNISAAGGINAAQSANSPPDSHATDGMMHLD